MAAADNGLFREELCCKACKDMRKLIFTKSYRQAILTKTTSGKSSVGGSVQAQKDSSYMYTAAGLACGDLTHATELCSVSFC